MGALITPDFFKSQKPSAVFLQEPVESLSEGIGSSYGVIRYRGKNWSLSYRGETHLFLRPDDGTPISYIDCIILRQAKVKAKSYYGDSGFDENASDGKRPVCASIDGIRPDSDVQQRQADVCALCPRNEFKTNQNGRRGRECTDYKRLAVLLMPGQTQRMLGVPLIEPVFLRVPPASLQDLGIYGDGMASQGWPYFAVVTRITFDTTAHPKFIFKGIQVLGDDEAKLVVDLRNDMLAKRITGEDILEQKAAVQIPTTTGSIGLVDARGCGTPVTATVTPPQMFAPLPPASQGASQPVQNHGHALDSLAGLYRHEQPLRQPVQTVLDLPAQGGGLFAEAPSEPTIQAVGQTAADTGEPASDPNLDAQIEALLQVK